MTDDEKLAIVDTEEEFAWRRLKSLDGDGVRPDDLDVIERCQRIRENLQGTKGEENAKQ